MRYVSVCSGIEAATVAWHPLGWAPLMFAEVAPFPSAVLAHHFPKVPNVGDFTQIRSAPAVGLLVGGTPCQAFSVAGLRRGLDDDRGNLALEFMRLADRLRPRWVLWENVPGVLSNNGGRDFGSILGALAELGYGFAWRVLDASFFGVPQRRRRVFLVGSLGDWRPAAAVLFERDSMRRDPPASRKTRTASAGNAAASARACGVFGDQAHALTASYDASEDGSGRGVPTVAVIPFDTQQITHAENRSRPEVGDHSPGITTGRPPAVVINARQDPITLEDACGPLDTDGTTYAVAYQCHGTNVGPLGTLKGCNVTNGVPFVASADPAYTLTAHHGRNDAEANCVRVRRLTPRECERLQGFPDDWTAVTGAKDSARYHALGNSMAVPVMRWIGERIDLVDRVVYTTPTR